MDTPAPDVLSRYSDCNRRAVPASSGADQFLPAYRYFGLVVRSEIPLPLPTVIGGLDVIPDCVVRRAPPGAVPALDGPVVATKPRADGSAQCIRHSDATGDWIWNREIGTIHLSADGAEVEVYGDEAADDLLLAMMVMGQVAVFLLHRRSVPCLHASAVRCAGGTAGFLGVHGQGKSTMAACFLRRGAELLTDDVLPVRSQPEGVMAGPSLPIMKMWPETVSEGLALSEPLPNLFKGLDKKLLEVGDRYPMVETATRLDALYVLFRFDPEAAGHSRLEIRPLTPREAMTALLSQVSWVGLFTPAEVARLMPAFLRLLAKLPVRLLSYPNGFEHQDAVYAGIVRDLEAL